MKADIKTRLLPIGGMTCISCQQRIQKRLQKTLGISRAEVDYKSGTATITYDAQVISLKDISALIHELGYEVESSGQPLLPRALRIVGLLVIIIALFLAIEQFGLLGFLTPGELAASKLSYGMLFVIGLFTSVHCVAMCGGINLSQSISKDESIATTAKGTAGAITTTAAKRTSKTRFLTLRPTILYHSGRVASYTVIGFIVGALGSVLTFSPDMQGILKVVAGVFMVIMGLNMLGFFPFLRKLTPRMPHFITQRVSKVKSGSSSPFYVGLLNGFMPCGPLQAMQIYALSTGSPLLGALSMLLFSLGTAPLTLGFGALGSVLSTKFKKVVSAGAVLVAVLGLSMFAQGWSLAGFGSISVPEAPSTTVAASLGSASSASSASSSSDYPQTVGEEGAQVIESTLSARSYPAITVQVGVPVKWVIDAPQGSITSCNNRMLIDEYAIEHTFESGENVIEFTPTQTGTFAYSCWMGMIRSSITVVEV